MKNLGILMSMTSSYIVESVNQEIGPFLCTFSADHQEDWAQFPKWEENAQNSFRYTSTNHTSFWDVLRYKPLSFGTPTPQTHQSWTGSSREVWEQAHQHIEYSAQVTKALADRVRGETPSYKPADWVWFSAQAIRVTEGCKKLSHCYIDPFKVLQCINDVTYKLNLQCHSCLAPSFYISSLKPVNQGPFAEASPPPLHQHP